jgi:hypothetical protein
MGSWVICTNAGPGLRGLLRLAWITVSISALSVAVRGMDRGSFELRGTILPEDGIMLTDGRVGIQLQALSGTWQGKELSATPDHAGRFRFKKVPTGMYLLSAFVPRVTRVRRTVEVGPSLADGEGRIEVSIRLAARRRRPAMFEVPASALTIPAAARVNMKKASSSSRTATGRGRRNTIAAPPSGLLNTMPPGINAPRLRPMLPAFPSLLEAGRNGPPVR